MKGGTAKKLFHWRSTTCSALISLFYLCLHHYGTSGTRNIYRGIKHKETYGGHIHKRVYARINIFSEAVPKFHLFQKIIDGDVEHKALTGQYSWDSH